MNIKNPLARAIGFICLNGLLCSSAAVLGASILIKANAKEFKELALSECFLNAGAYVLATALLFKIFEPIFCFRTWLRANQGESILTLPALFSAYQQSVLLNATVAVEMVFTAFFSPNTQNFIVKQVSAYFLGVGLIEAGLGVALFFGCCCFARRSASVSEAPFEISDIENAETTDTKNSTGISLRHARFSIESQNSQNSQSSQSSHSSHSSHSSRSSQNSQHSWVSLNSERMALVIQTCLLRLAELGLRANDLHSLNDWVVRESAV